LVFDPLLSTAVVIRGELPLDGITRNDIERIMVPQVPTTVLDTRHTGSQAEWIDQGMRVVDVAVEVGGGRESQWIRAGIAGRFGVVVPEVVVVEPRFGVEVLAREAEWCVCRTVRSPC